MLELDTQGRQQVIYFVGTEVENTAMKNEKTLFVVGVRPVEEIIKHATDNKLRHLYFGTSQSFQPKSQEDWRKWDAMITPLLKQGYWVTLDFGVEFANDIHEESWNEFFTFIPMISVKLPYIKLYNYNATLKIDDTTWGHSNPGVWCHPLDTLKSREVYTDWKDYIGDTPIKE
jgi:hypothetical protein